MPPVRLNALRVCKTWSRLDAETKKSGERRKTNEVQSEDETARGIFNNSGPPAFVFIC